MFEEPEQLRAIGYYRVACVGQDSKKRVFAQEDKVARHMAMQDLEYVKGFFEEGQPGSALMDAYDYCEEQNDITYLVVSDFTRLSRDLSVCKAWIAKFLELGVEIVEAHDYKVNLLPSVPEKSKAQR
ncbi:MAG TPA: recombinase family protein [Candidatus Saccharimonadales bacterium]|nr:recombinase family protein [Candidatus Saccharimonadales bacterium]